MCASPPPQRLLNALSQKWFDAVETQAYLAQARSFGGAAQNSQTEQNYQNDKRHCSII